MGKVLNIADMNDMRSVIGDSSGSVQIDLGSELRKGTIPSATSPGHFSGISVKASHAVVVGTITGVSRARAITISTEFVVERSASRK